MASSLRAGFSLMQGLEAVAQEITDPMRKELQRVFTESRLGRPIEDAATSAAQANVPVSTIAFGTDQGRVEIQGQSQPVPVDRQSLHEAAGPAPAADGEAL